MRPLEEENGEDPRLSLMRQHCLSGVTEERSFSKEALNVWQDKQKDLFQIYFVRTSFSPFEVC